MHRNSMPSLSKITDWSFIGGVKENNKSSEETIYRDVERETSIKLKGVELVSDVFYNNSRKHFYFAKLTDENVNDMKREDGQTLDFFNLRELDRLNLTASTKLFVVKHRDLLEQAYSS